MNDVGRDLATVGGGMALGAMAATQDGLVGRLAMGRTLAELYNGQEVRNTRLLNALMARAPHSSKGMAQHIASGALWSIPLSLGLIAYSRLRNKTNDEPAFGLPHATAAGALTGTTAALSKDLLQGYGPANRIIRGHERGVILLDDLLSAIKKVPRIKPLAGRALLGMGLGSLGGTLLYNKLMNKDAAWRPMVGPEEIREYLENEVEREAKIETPQDEIELQNAAQRLNRYNTALNDGDPYAVMGSMRSAGEEDAHRQRRRAAAIGGAAGAGVMGAAGLARGWRRGVGMAALGALGGYAGGHVYGNRYPDEASRVYNDLERGIATDFGKLGAVAGQGTYFMKHHLPWLKKNWPLPKKAPGNVPPSMLSSLSPTLKVLLGLGAGGGVGYAAADLADGRDETMRIPSYDPPSGQYKVAADMPMVPLQLWWNGPQAQSNLALKQRLRERHRPSAATTARLEANKKIRSNLRALSEAEDYFKSNPGPASSSRIAPRWGRIGKAVAIGGGVLGAGLLGAHLINRDKTAAMDSYRAVIDEQIGTLVNEKEAKYLHAVLDEAEAFLAARRGGEKLASARFSEVEGALDKVAFGFSNIGRTLSGVGSAVGAAIKKNPIQALIAAGLLAGPVAGILRKPIQAAVDPFVEEYRFRQLMGLPGAPIVMQTGTPDDYFIDPSLPQEERQQLALRKAFDMVHKYSPELTATPELLRVFMNTAVNSGPLALIRGANDFAAQDLNLNVARQKLRTDLASMFSGGAKAVNDLSGGYLDSFDV